MTQHRTDSLVGVSGQDPARAGGFIVRVGMHRHERKRLICHWQQRMGESDGASAVEGFISPTLHDDEPALSKRPKPLGGSGAITGARQLHMCSVGQSGSSMG